MKMKREHKEEEERTIPEKQKPRAEMFRSSEQRNLDFRKLSSNVIIKKNKKR